MGQYCSIFIKIIAVYVCWKLIVFIVEGQKTGKKKKRYLDENTSESDDYTDSGMYIHNQVFLFYTYICIFNPCI